MIKFINHVLKLFEGDALYAMATVSPKKTGLPFGVFVSQMAGAKHDIRVKISSTNNSAKLDIVVALRPDIKLIHGKLERTDFEMLKLWLILNKAALVGYWDGDIEYTDDLLTQLVSI